MRLESARSRRFLDEFCIKRGTGRPQTDHFRDSRTQKRSGVFGQQRRQSHSGQYREHMSYPVVWSLAAISDGIKRVARGTPDECGSLALFLCGMCFCIGVS